MLQAGDQSVVYRAAENLWVRLGARSTGSILGIWQPRPFVEAALRNHNPQHTHLFQHDLRVAEVLQHGLDISLIGRPWEEAPRDSLHALHLATWQQLRETPS